MNDLQIFNNEQFGKIRAVEIDGEPWFCLADICKPLGLRATVCKNRLKPEGVTTIDTPTKSGTQGMLWVNEGNLYRAIFQSKKPEAEAFTDWVTEEVLPPSLPPQGSSCPMLAPRRLITRSNSSSALPLASAMWTIWWLWSCSPAPIFIPLSLTADPPTLSTEASKRGIGSLCG